MYCTPVTSFHTSSWCPWLRSPAVVVLSIMKIHSCGLGKRQVLRRKLTTRLGSSERICIVGWSSTESDLRCAPTGHVGLRPTVQILSDEPVDVTRQVIILRAKTAVTGMSRSYYKVAIFETQCIAIHCASKMAHCLIVVAHAYARRHYVLPRFFLLFSNAVLAGHWTKCNKTFGTCSQHVQKGARFENAVQNLGSLPKT